MVSALRDQLAAGQEVTIFTGDRSFEGTVVSTGPDVVELSTGEGGARILILSSAITVVRFPEEDTG